jgi:GH15 family glucan-1,4-alpha-glucosidase
MNYKPIQDYAIIGNRRSAALVAKDGTIDWAPAPFLDSPSVFAAILDSTKGGFWAIRPKGKFESEQDYIHETNVLVTRFRTAKGRMEVVDYMPVRNGNNNGYGHGIVDNGVYEKLRSEKEESLEIHRKIICKEGVCNVEIVFEPRFDYARGNTKLSLIKGGVCAENGNYKGVLMSKASYQIHEGRATATLVLKQGESQYLEFFYNATKGVANKDAHYEQELHNTREFWQEWVHRCDLETCPIEYPWHEAVMRSSLVLKILFLEPPGSIAAAATTSLPEEIGGERNWDYRFSWLRDSAFTLQALFWLGYIKEADEYVKWLIHECGSVEDGPGNLQIMYGLRGQKKLTEETLDHLEGYMKSAPVRIGNGAFDQRQLDVYGGILNMVWRLHRMRNGYELSPQIWVALRAIANYVVNIWEEEDRGVWEVRGPKRHYVHSKVMCWVALDRALKLVEAYGYDAETEVWKKTREEIRSQIMEKGWSEKKQAFTQSFGSDELDASTLLMPVLGFIKGDDPKMISTVAAIEKELAIGDGLYARYKFDDGLLGGEGAFLLCSFWMVDALVFAGQKEKAQELFEKLLTYRNHVGLYSEEIDPKTKDFLGNFPQAYTHIGLINSAFYLSFDKKTLENIIS